MNGIDPGARSGSFLGTAAVFLIVPPLLATVVGGVLWHFGIGRGTGTIGPTDTLSAFAWYGVISVFVGWPAMIAMAVLMPWRSPRLKSRFAWLGGSAVICGLLVLASAMAVGGGGDFSEMLALSWVFLLVGAAGGLASALITDRFRPRNTP